MTKLMFACVAAFALTACPHKHDSGGDALSKMTELKDKMCACKTPACATAVTEEQTKWAQSMAKTEPQKLSEEETKKLAAVGQAFAKCLAEATKVAAPEPAPAAPAPVETGSAGSSGSAGSTAK